jgi:pimeloyl-ACP methyl ester carboxylesterase
MAEAQKTQKSGRGSKIVVAFGILAAVGLGVPFLAFAAMAIATAIPTDLERLDQRYPAIDDREGRVIGGRGCGLNERANGDRCEPLRDLRVDEDEVTFASSHPERGLARLRGTLSRPRGIEGRLPAAILVHGSGPNCRDEEVPGDLLTQLSPPFPLFRELAKELSAQGIIVLRYDKRHCHTYRDFVFDPETFEWSHFTDDARDALAYLASRDDVDPNALVVIGHSEGGQLAPFIAEGDERVAAVVMLGGTTQRFGDLLAEQLERYAAVRHEQHDYLAGILTGPQIMQIRACVAKIDTPGYDPNEQCIAGGVTLRALAAHRDEVDRMPRVMRALDCPLFAIQGNADINIDPEEIPRIREIMEGRDVEVHRVRGVSHAFTNAMDPPDPMAIDTRVIELLTEMFASVKR